MSEYISRNEVYQKLHEAGGCDASDEWGRGYDAGITEAIDIIDNIPSADAAPIVHGHWDCGYDMFEYAICSSCKWDSGEAWEYAKKNFKFCPHCGAKMDESEDENDV